MSPALIEALLEVARRARDAGHGGKEAIYAEACRHLGLSRATLLRHLKACTVQAPRKRRADAGQVSLSRTDAQLLSAALMEGYRANDKAIHSLKLALQRLRANRPGFACVVDAQTGELLPLSDSACARALRTYSLHPEQLRQPAPVTQLASDHPNDVWQIDASISTLFYVPDDVSERGLADMAPREFNKNKPANFEKIKRQRLTRYVLTDHCSGSIFVHYVAGGESAVNMAEAFLAAIQPRPEAQMHGVPFHLMMDPGSAGIGGAFKNLLRRLQVAPVINQAGNPRAKGQVENAHNLVETNFESGFKFTHVPGLDWINAQAQLWMRYYNSVPKHSRHGMARWHKWMEITQQQLRLVDAELARQLLTHEPETPKVTPALTVRFAARVWNVRDVPGVLVGERLAITYNPFDQARAYVVQPDADGNEQLIEVPEQQEGEHGFAAGAAHIAREYKAAPDTAAAANRKHIERVATGTATDAAAAAARKAKALPLPQIGGLDPYKHHAELPAATLLPRRGTELDAGVQVSAAAEPPLSPLQACRALDRRGFGMTPERAALVRQWHPDGLPEADIHALQQRLQAHEQAAAARPVLRVVGGQ